MFADSDVQKIFSLVQPSAKREGIDFTFAELYDSVKYLASAHESNINVPLSSFRRAKKQLEITTNDRGFYSRADVAALLGWFASQGQYKTYASYRPVAIQIYKQFA